MKEKEKGKRQQVIKAKDKDEVNTKANSRGMSTEEKKTEKRAIFKNKEKAPIKEKGMIFGSQHVIKLLKSNKIKKVTIAKDLEQGLKERIIKLAKAKNAEIIESKKTRKEIAEELKKPFSIGCVGMM